MPQPEKAPDSIPSQLLDAFRHVFGRSGVQPLRALWAESEVKESFAPLREAFLRGLAYGLPSIGDRILDYGALGVSQALQKEKIWNVFLRNPHASGIAATLVWLHESEKHLKLGARTLSEATVPHYLAFATLASYRASETYRAVVQAGETAPSTEEIKPAFDALVHELSDSLRKDECKEIATGIYALLDALLVIREKREEESPLTLDIVLPLSCSWDLALNAASRGDESSLAKAKVLEKQVLLKKLPKMSLDDIVEELDKAGRYMGRGVCELSLRNVKSAGSGIFEKSRIWPDHSHAPLSRLYGLSWDLPQDIEEPNVRMVLLGNSTISIQSQGDPFFEYLLGDWSYVDVVSKSALIASLVAEGDVDPEDLRLTVYRLARFAYQLAYHNHGSTVSVNLSDPVEAREKLNELRDLWDVDEIDAEGLSLPSSTRSGGTDRAPDLKRHLGRLAYSLALQDGSSVWKLGPDGNDIHLHDFGRYRDVQDEILKPLWKPRAVEMGLDPDVVIKGGRHKSAFMQSIWTDGHRKVVFCISQDGFVEAFIDGFFVRLR